MLSPQRTPRAEQSNGYFKVRPKLIEKRNSKGHKVSFSDTSKSSGDDAPPKPLKINSAPSSRSASPRPGFTRPSAPARKKSTDARNWHTINRQNEALWLEDIPSPPSPTPSSHPNKPFLIYHPSFLPLLGTAPTITLLLNDTRAPYFHSAGIYHAPTSTLYITSNLISSNSPSHAPSANKKTTVTKLTFYSPTDFTRDIVRTPEKNPLIASGANYHDGLVLCAQGTMSNDDDPAGIIYMSVSPPHRTSSLIRDFHGRPFNSPKDCAVCSRDSSIWFTDPMYGFEKGFRAKPSLPQHVYRFDPTTGDIRVVADGFGRPNAICFSGDENTLYVTDTDSVHYRCDTPEARKTGLPTKVIDTTKASTIYAYTVMNASTSTTSKMAPASTGTAVAIVNGEQHTLPSSSSMASTFLTNRRVFAFPDNGSPECLACDAAGNVYAGCGDGVHVWSAGGVLIGKVLIEGGVTGFCFGGSGEAWAWGEDKVWRIAIGGNVKGAVGKGEENLKVGKGR
ncbi:hypothetical protein MMC25_007227 [Agyrium rufum]|nr:hypothetical protein [Agyrium rufum]